MTSEAAVLIARAAGWCGLAALLAFFAASVWLSAVDLATRRLPNRLVAGLSATVLGLLLASSGLELATAARAAAVGHAAALLAGAAVAFTLCYVMWRAAPTGIGGGDVKLAPLIGGVLGWFGGIWSVLCGLALACVIVVVWSVIARSARHRGAAGSLSNAPRSGVPFAPGLFAAAWLTLVVSTLLF